MPEHAREQVSPQYIDFKQAMASPRFSELRDSTQSYIQGLAAQADELLVRLGVDRLEDYDERQVKTEEGGEQLLAELDLFMELFSRVLEAMEKDHPPGIRREFEISLEEGERLKDVFMSGDDFVSVLESGDSKEREVCARLNADTLEEETIGTFGESPQYFRNKNGELFIVTNGLQKNFILNEKGEKIFGFHKMLRVLDTQEETYFLIEDDAGLINIVDKHGKDLIADANFLYDAMLVGEGVELCYCDIVREVHLWTKEGRQDIEFEGSIGYAHIVLHEGKSLLVCTKESSNQFEIVNENKQVVAVSDTLGTVAQMKSLGSEYLLALNNTTSGVCSVVLADKHESTPVLKNREGEVIDLVSTGDKALILVRRGGEDFVYNESGKEVASLKKARLVQFDDDIYFQEDFGEIDSRKAFEHSGELRDKAVVAAQYFVDGHQYTFGFKRDIFSSDEDFVLVDSTAGRGLARHKYIDCKHVASQDGVLYFVADNEDGEGFFLTDSKGVVHGSIEGIVKDVVASEDKVVVITQSTSVEEEGKEVVIRQEYFIDRVIGNSATNLKHFFLLG
jgi:hypothetical protein